MFGSFYMGGMSHMLNKEDYYLVRSPPADKRLLIKLRTEG